jgi:hypothetical protein
MRLRECQSFSAATGASILDTPTVPASGTWIRVTEAEAGTRSTELIATIHVRSRSKKDEVSRLVDDAKQHFRNPPALDDIPLASWSVDFTEVRLEDEDMGYHGLVRFRARVVTKPIGM